MLSFASDYTEGACEEILQKLAETEPGESAGIWLDRYCQSGRQKNTGGEPDARRRRFIFWWAVPRRMRS